VLWFLGLSYSQAQFTTEGKEFWVGFMGIGTVTPTQELFITSRYNTTGTVSVPKQGWTQNFSVMAGQTTIVNLPAVYATDSETVQDKGVYVNSINDVSIYAVNKVHAGTEATMVIPIQSIGNVTSYIINTYKGVQHPFTGSQSQVLIVGMKNGTQISITPKQNTVGGKIAGQPFQIALDSGQVYQIQTALLPIPIE
jgi:hypothetical protein